MNINRLETHDRLLHFQKQAEKIYEGCMDCLKNIPDAVKFPVYIFAHPRTIEADEKKALLLTGIIPRFKEMPTTRLIWMPRVTKPKAQTNSYLFLAKKNDDLIKIIWMIPPRDLWEQYAPGKMTHNEEIWTSIQNFQYAREKLEAPDPDGPSEKNIQEFRKIYAQEARKKKREKEIAKAKLAALEGFSPTSAPAE